MLLALGLAAPAHADVRLEIDGIACSHVPGANYVEPPGVEYQPGVDVNGNAVAPADIGPQIKLPDKFIIPVTSNMFARLSSSSGTASQAAAATANPGAILGIITYDHGHLSFNGQPLGDDGAAPLARYAGTPMTASVARSRRLHNPRGAIQPWR